MSKETISILKQNDKNYPRLLSELNEIKDVKNAPEKLYIKGNPDALTAKPNFAIVGTRKLSRAGYDLGFQISRELAEAGFTIISGLADGGDTAAHKGALDACIGAPLQRCITVAVLGTSLEEEYIYPKSNLELSREIIKSGGALISEYPEKQKGAYWTFPARNRIVAGMSLGILVLECPYKSGAMITASIAQKLNRPVFAVPGHPNTRNAQGPNELIHQGAYLTRGSKDIINVLTEHYPEIKTKQETKSKAKGTTEEAIKTEKTAHKKILKILESEPLHIDKIAEAANMSALELNPLIVEMEMEGLIKEVRPKVYATD